MTFRVAVEEVVVVVIEEEEGIVRLCATAVTGFLFSADQKYLSNTQMTLELTQATAHESAAGLAILLGSVLKEMEATLVEVECATAVTGDWVHLLQIYVGFLLQCFLA